MEGNLTEKIPSKQEKLEGIFFSYIIQYVLTFIIEI